MIVQSLFKISKGKKAVESATVTGLRYIQIDDLRNDNNLKFALASKGNVLCTKQDVLIAWDGANAGTVGYYKEGVIGSTLAKLTPISDQVYTSYAGRFLQSKFNYLRENCTGATIPHISRSSLENLDIPLPPLPAQKKIAAILDAADEHRQKSKALIAKYDELAQSLFLDMFGDPYSNLKRFPVYSLENVCIKITDGEHGTVKRQDSGKLYLMARNIRDNFIDLEDVSYISDEDHKKIYKRCNPEKGDLLLVCVGATIGRACVMPDIGPFSLARSVALLKPNHNKITSQYLYSYISSRYVQELIKKSGNSSAQAGLYTGKIKELKIQLPPIKLQEQFSERVKIIEEQKSIARAISQKSEELFNSLLQKAFKGELVSL